MDELEIDVQVLYPSVFLRPLTSRQDAELALAQSYNRWLADIWSQGKDRLRWAAIMPTMSIDATVAELRWAREHGACAAFTCGIVRDMSLDNPYFYPVYETLSDLDMPLCIHAGNHSFLWEDLFDTEGGYSRAKLAVVSAFHSLVFHGIPQRFPKLRVGFIEAASQWVPGTIHDIARRIEKRTGQPFDRSAVLRENRLYVTCQTDDDLPYVLKYAGESNLIVGTDYGHNDTATEIDALRYMKTQGQVTADAISRILGDNAQALYGL